MAELSWRRQASREGLHPRGEAERRPREFGLAGVMGRVDI